MSWERKFLGIPSQVGHSSPPCLNTCSVLTPRESCEADSWLLTLNQQSNDLSVDSNFMTTKRSVAFLKSHHCRKKWNCVKKSWCSSLFAEPLDLGSCPCLRGVVMMKRHCFSCFASWPSGFLKIYTEKMLPFFPNGMVVIRSWGGHES